METASSTEIPVVIKKYANRRLYDTKASSYVTLDDLCKMVKEGLDFEVRDARTGEDITRTVLAQIVLEEETKGQNLLPIRFLRQLIRMYGDSMESLVPGYLDISMESFAKNQELMRDRVTEAFDGGTQIFENMARQNVAAFERAMKMFSPFSAMEATDEPAGAGRAAPAAAGPDDIGELRSEIAAMRKQLAELARRAKR